MPYVMVDVESDGPIPGDYSSRSTVGLREAANPNLAHTDAT